jgi:hypothetical protein
VSLGAAVGLAVSVLVAVSDAAGLVVDEDVPDAQPVATTEAAKNATARLRGLADIAGATTGAKLVALQNGHADSEERTCLWQFEQSR